MDTIIERGDAWSCGSHLVTTRAEARIKVNMLKMSEQKDARVRGPDDIFLKSNSLIFG